MINYRYISAIIYIVISSPLFAFGNIATGQESKTTELEVREVVAPQEDSEPGLKSQLNVNATGQAKDKPILRDTSADNGQGKDPDRISKQWSAVGIFGTSGLFIFMIWILFKEDESKAGKKLETKLATAVKPSTVASEKKQIDGQTKEPKEPKEPIRKITKSAISPLAVDKENSVKQGSFPMIGMDFDPELNSDPEKSASEELSQLQPIKAIEPEMTIAEVSENIALDEDLMVDADIMGKLTIVNANTADTAETEIDVVSELIRDLEQSNQIGDLVRGKDLRRKAIWELGQSNDFRAVEPLIQTIPKADSLEKSLILDAITQIANRSFASINQALLASLEDNDAEVRKNAIQDLTSLYHSMSTITIRLSKMTDDRDLEVRQTAKWALEQFNQMADAATSAENSNINLSSG